MRWDRTRVVVGCLLSASRLPKCISGTDLLRQFYVLSGGNMPVYLRDGSAQTIQRAIRRQHASVSQGRTGSAQFYVLSRGYMPVNLRDRSAQTILPAVRRLHASESQGRICLDNSTCCQASTCECISGTDLLRTLTSCRINTEVAD